MATSGHHVPVWINILFSKKIVIDFRASEYDTWRDIESLVSFPTVPARIQMYRRRRSRKVQEDDAISNL